MFRVYLFIYYNLDCLFFDCQSLIFLPDISNWYIFNDNINLDGIIDDMKKTKKIRKFRENLLDLNASELSQIPEAFYNFENKPNICSPYFDLNIKPGEDYINLIENKKFTLTGIFAGCSSLKELPDISKWNTKNVIKISFLFCGCSSLKTLPDISK